MSKRSRTMRAITDTGSAYRQPKPHRKWRVTKKRVKRFQKEFFLAWKWLNGRHDWATTKVRADEMMQMFGQPESTNDKTPGPEGPGVSIEVVPGYGR